jgi:tetratricopeptide (TPR) repeat protein
MIECLSCHAQLEDLRVVCPSCGGKMFVHSGATEDALAGLEAMGKQAKAAEYVNRGSLLIMEGRYAEATQILKMAIAVNPFDANAYSNMGDIFLRQGQTKEAISWFEKALEINPYLEGVPDALQQARAFTGKSTQSRKRKKWWQFWKRVL